MGARGFNIAEEGHVVPLIEPQSISGGVASQIFSMRDSAKCNIVLMFGALAAAEGAVQLFACTDITGATQQAISFDVYKQETGGTSNDVLGARTTIASTGYTPADVANIFDVLHIQGDQLPQGYPYLQLKIADGTNADYAAAFAVLSGLRYAGVSNPTVTT